MRRPRQTIFSMLLLLLLSICNSSVGAWDHICVTGTAYASSLYEEKYSNAFFIPRKNKFLLLTSEIFCIWGKQKSLVLAGLGIYKFIEKNKFLKIYTNFWRTHMRPRRRICVLRRGRICVLEDAYAGSTKLLSKWVLYCYWMSIKIWFKFEVCNILHLEMGAILVSKTQ